MSIVSNNIKFFRRVHKLTQEQFARKIGIKRSLLGAYEEARANPNYENLMNIANIFGVTTDQLLKTDFQRQSEVKGIPPPMPSQPVMIEENQSPLKLGNLMNQFFNDADDEQDELERIFSQPIPRNNSNLNPVDSTFPNPVVLEPVSSFNTKNTFPLNEKTINHPFDTQKNNINFPPKSQEKAKQFQTIEWVSQKEMDSYINSCVYPDYLKQLPGLTLPMLTSGNFRAFEAGQDFNEPGATLIGEYVQNWYDMHDGHSYVVVVNKKGVLYRRVFSQVKFKGTLLLSSDNLAFPIMEVSIKEVLECWEVKMLISNKLPEVTSLLPALERMDKIIGDLQEEIRLLRG